jgi:hypothetical protein
MDEVVSFAELERFIDLPVRTYSSGMYMRLGFAIATHVRAQVLLLDEVFAVGDEAFQRKCFGKIFEFKSRGGTIVFVSHDASAVERLCERALLLRDGRVEADGFTHDVMQRYHAQLAAEEDPAERGAGLTEWGTGHLRVVEAKLEDLDGEERVQVLSGEPVVLRLVVEGQVEVPPPRVSVELRDRAGRPARRGGGRDRGARLVRRARSPNAPFRARPPAARRRSFSGSASRSRTGREAGSTTESTVRPSFSSIRTRRSTAPCGSTAAGRSRRHGTELEPR